VYRYHSSGLIEFEKRDILEELGKKHDAGFAIEALVRGGYQQMVTVGKVGAASLEVYLSHSFETEFSGVALLQLGEGLEHYVFQETHAAMVFVKEFSPMIAAILQANTLAKAL